MTSASAWKLVAVLALSFVFGTLWRILWNMGTAAKVRRRQRCADGLCEHSGHRK